MAKIRKEPKSATVKLNTSNGKKTQQPKKDVKPKVVKDIKPKVLKDLKHIKPKGIRDKIQKEKRIEEILDVVDLKKLQVDEKQLRSGIDALLKYFGRTKKKNLFESEIPIFAQFHCIRIAQGPNRRLRITLKHSLITDTSEVCLIVPDLKKGKRYDHEPTIEHYETLLKQKGVTGVTRILPFRQLKVEYDQHELKRRLCGYYDHFLVDGRISGHVSHCLGQIFYEKRKLPVPIRLTNQDLKTAIEDGMKRVQINLHSEGTSYGVQIGHNGMTVDMLTDNLVALITALEASFPGRWYNIRSLYVSMDKSIAVPVYATLRNSSDVLIPVTKPLRPKLFEEVRGELSTKYNADVIVDPSGEVHICKPHKNNFIPKELEEDAVNSDNNDEEIKDEDDDALAASAEEAYMTNLLMHKELKAKTAT